MKACALAGMLVLALDDVSAAAAADPDPLASAPAAATAQAPPAVPLSDEALRKAVRDALAQEPPTRKPDGAVLRGDSYRAFSRQFSEAQKPSCLGPDALRHQPSSTVIGGWNIGLAGLLALPFWGAAVVRGKCQ